MESKQIAAAYESHRAKAMASPAGEDWRRSESKAVLFGTDEFGLDRERRRVELGGAVSGSFPADDSVFEGGFEPEWMALLEGPGGRPSVVVALGDPFGPAGLACLPSVGGWVSAVPGSILGAMMGSMRGSATREKAPALENRGQRRARERKERRG